MSSPQFLDYDKALACIHCGLCLPSCPTYLETGNENDSPRGRIYLMRAVQKGTLPLGRTAVRHMDLCLGCRACEAVCPSGVQYGELLEATREHIEDNYQRSAFQTFLRRVAIEKVFPFPRRMRLALALGNLVPRCLVPKCLSAPMDLLPRDYPFVRLPEFSPATPVLQPFSPEPFRQAQGPEHVEGLMAEGHSNAPAPRVGFLRGCVQSVLFGETNTATVRLLNRAGLDVITPREQVCCGALYAHGGNLERARECARRNIEVFERHPLDKIIVNAAGCGSTLKEYGALLHDDKQWATRAREFSAKVRDLSEILNAQRSTLNVQRSSSGLVTYHDACHLAHAQRITSAPRELVRAVAQDKFVELPEAAVCCGSAGSYNLTEPDMAARLQRRKIENILKSGAEVVVTTNPGCILQIQAGLRQAGAGHVQVVHLADYLCKTSEESENA